jgi:hypothetical protein
MEYFLTPESSSSSHFSAALSSSANSAAAKKSGDHGYVSPSAVKRREWLLLLMNLDVLLSVSLVFALVPMRAKPG